MHFEVFVDETVWWLGFASKVDEKCREKLLIIGNCWSWEIGFKIWSSLRKWETETYTFKNSKTIPWEKKSTKLACF